MLDDTAHLPIFLLRVRICGQVVAHHVATAFDQAIDITINPIPDLEGNPTFIYESWVLFLNPTYSVACKII